MECPDLTITATVRIAMSDTPSFPKEQEPSSIRRRRYIEAARIAETKFRIRCERAALMIARTGCDTRAACRT